MGLGLGLGLGLDCAADVADAARELAIAAHAALARRALLSDCSPAPVLLRLRLGLGLGVGLGVTVGVGLELGLGSGLGLGLGLGFAPVLLGQVRPYLPYISAISPLYLPSCSAKSAPCSSAHSSFFMEAAAS